MNKQSPAIAAALLMLCTGCATKSGQQPGQLAAANPPQYRAPARQTVAPSQKREPVENVSQGALGVWSGSNGAERITVKFGAGGSLILTNASGSEAGRWSGSRNSYQITIGEFSGTFILLNSNTASFTLGSSHVEMRRGG